MKIIKKHIIETKRKDSENSNIMYLIKVTPFSKSIKTSHFTYFSKKYIEPGLVVTIPVRKQNVKGLVIGVSEGLDAKQEIRNAGYEMKKIKGVAKNPLFTSQFIEASNEAAHFFATSAGSIINSLVPKTILDDPSKFQTPEPAERKVPSKKETKPAKFIIQNPDDERYSHYKSLVRSKFAKNKSVFFCVPTIEDCHYASDKITKGIETDTFVFHSKMTKKKIEEQWKKVANRKKATLVIATGNFLALPIWNLGTIILERENSGAYKIMQRPYFDLRKFAEIYAEKNHAEVVLGDVLLRAETLWRYDEGELNEYTPIKFRSLATCKGEVIDMKEEKARINEKKQTKIHPILSKKVQRLLEKSSAENHKTFLFVSRKGLAPIIVCGDCGQTVTCNTCEAPVVLYGKDTKNKNNHFRCHACGDQRFAGERCGNCDSWNLIPLGIGTEKVVEEVEKIISTEKIFRIDKDVAKTPKQARDILKKFSGTPGGVLIGTEMTLLYLRDEIENVAIISIDSMFSIPDFQIKERILNILLRSRALANQKFLIQTRNSEQKLFEEAVRGNLADFYRAEFIERKKFNYPPFSLLIKITAGSNNRAKLHKEFEVLEKYFSPHAFVFFPSFTFSFKGQFFMSGIIKVPRGAWPDELLADKLRNLPPQYKIEIDAQSVI